MAKQKHIKIVKAGSEAIEKWKREHPKTKLDLSGAHLRRIDLTNANLNGAILRGANLEWGDFRWADLIKADLTNASLDRADFHKADMASANLAEAKLTNTNFEDANLCGATFSKALLAHARFINTDVGDAKGLDHTIHSGPSVIDIETISKSGHLPTEFLRGCGLSDQVIEATHASDIDILAEALEAESSYYSCFISYSSLDSRFVEKLYTELQGAGVRCWFAPKDMKTGAKILDSIYKAIRLHEKLLLILSKNSVASGWVEDEVTKAFSEERDRKDTVVFPVRLDDAVMLSESAWAEKIRTNRNIGDFRNWKSKSGYSEAFKVLLRDLKRNRGLQGRA